MQKLLPYLAQFGADSDAKQGASAVLRYFEEAAPKHHADEEEDLLPMLQKTASGDDAQTLNRLVPEIMQEHQQMDALWENLAIQLRGIASGEAAALSVQSVEHFSTLYSAHMEKEEGHIAPMAKRLFNAEQMSTLGCAMKRRRGINE